MTGLTRSMDENNVDRSLKDLPQPFSITHAHFVNIIQTTLADRYPSRKRIRILDVGCGNGRLLLFLHTALATLMPQYELEMFGFDIFEQAGSERADYLNAMADELSAAAPLVDWGQRISLVAHDAPWPYDDGYFDVVLSNQVLEHVLHRKNFFSEHARCLRSGGLAVHVCPLASLILEAHLVLPLLHAIRSHDLRRSYIRFWSRLGLGLYPKHARERGVTVEQFSEYQADYMLKWTNYCSFSDIAYLCKEHGMRCSYTYTRHFYLIKLLQVLGRSPYRRYPAQPSQLAEMICFQLLKRLSSATVVIERP